MSEEFRKGDYVRSNHLYKIDWGSRFEGIVNNPDVGVLIGTGERVISVRTGPKWIKPNGVVLPERYLKRTNNLSLITRLKLFGIKGVMKNNEGT